MRVWPHVAQRIAASPLLLRRHIVWQADLADDFNLALDGRSLRSREELRARKRRPPKVLVGVASSRGLRRKSPRFAELVRIGFSPFLKSGQSQ